jgi:hypothetical protein
MRPEFPRAYFYARASDGVPLLRVDTQSPMTVAEAETHCGAEYGFPVTCTEVSDVHADDFEAFKIRRLAQALASPPGPTPEPTAREQYAAATVDAERLAVLAKHVGVVEESE